MHSCSRIDGRYDIAVSTRTTELLQRNVAAGSSDPPIWSSSCTTTAASTEAQPSDDIPGKRRPDLHWLRDGDAPPARSANSSSIRPASMAGQCPRLRLHHPGGVTPGTTSRPGSGKDPRAPIDGGHGSLTKYRSMSFGRYLITWDRVSEHPLLEAPLEERAIARSPNGAEVLASVVEQPFEDCASFI